MPKHIAALYNLSQRPHLDKKMEMAKFMTSYMSCLTSGFIQQYLSSCSFLDRKINSHAKFLLRSMLYCHFQCFWLYGKSQKFIVRHDTERCQFFNSMVYSCLYHDRASLVLSESELVAARINGIQFTLSSGKKDYESIVLPANYIQGFLQATE